MDALEAESRELENAAQELEKERLSLEDRQGSGSRSGRTTWTPWPS